jgi:hypothetical protein
VHVPRDYGPKASRNAADHGLDGAWHPPDHAAVTDSDRHAASPRTVLRGLGWTYSQALVAMFTPLARPRACR